MSAAEKRRDRTAHTCAPWWSEWRISRWLTRYRTCLRCSWMEEAL